MPWKVDDKIMKNSAIIEAFIMWLCSQVKKEAADRKLLFDSLCKLVFRYNDLYVPLNDTYSGNPRYHLNEFWSVIKRTQLIEDVMPFQSSNTNLLVDHSLTLYNPAKESFALDRYGRDFHELSFLGSGGFGTVVKAIHLLDGTEYAVKKIPISCHHNRAKYIRRLLREAQALASLDHPNIVRYYSAWIQPYTFPYANVKEVSEVSSTSLSHAQTWDSDAQGKMVSGDNPLNTDWLKHTDSSLFSTHQPKCTSSIDIVFADSTSSHPTCDQSPSADGKFSGNLKSQGINLLHSDGSSDEPSNFCVLPKSVCLLAPVRCMPQFLFDTSDPQAQLTLFIQMRLYGPSLRKWLEDRTHLTKFFTSSFELVNEQKCLGIFRDILKALQYIHSKKIIHRDVKPDNLLFSTDMRSVLLCDFGLSRQYLQNHQSAFISKNKMLENYVVTKNIGTTLYASPEVLSGASYDYKTDMFSAGILLVELFYPFMTSSERHKCLSWLQKEHLVDHILTENYPLVSELSLSLTSPVPSLRPSATGVLAHPLMSEIACQLQKMDHIFCSSRESEKCINFSSVERDSSAYRVCGYKNCQKALLDCEKVYDEKTKEITMLRKENEELKKKLALLESQMKR